ncbi:hypothetical protein D7Z54_14095 [Salibacterium salarium]|uniref:Uncharacterized protein n=1 Tax=Salibacterium salarium TaxID=284579 RepID=A0A3R9PK65_9BACI|nr:hypothetical protein D7Z54_14095 [Salibacterium salarium]
MTRERKCHPLMIHSTIINTNSLLEKGKTVFIRAKGTIDSLWDKQEVVSSIKEHDTVISTPFGSKNFLGGTLAWLKTVNL